MAVSTDANMVEEVLLDVETENCLPYLNDESDASHEVASEDIQPDIPLYNHDAQDEQQMILMLPKDVASEIVIIETIPTPEQLTECVVDSRDKYITVDSEGNVLVISSYPEDSGVASEDSPSFTAYELTEQGSDILHATTSSADVLAQGLDIITTNMTTTEALQDKLTMVEHCQVYDGTIRELAKREKDRLKKQQQRQNPAYRQKEKEKSKIRMQALRTNSSYRTVEREKDRTRRRIARQTNITCRQRERFRDRVHHKMNRNLPFNSLLSEQILLEMAMSKVTDSVQVTFSESQPDNNFTLDESCNIHDSEIS